MLPRLDLGPVRNPAVFIIALALAFYLTPIIRRGAIRYGVLDVPDQGLKRHATPTPYLGGIAVFLAFLFTLAFTYDFTKEVLGILLGSSIIVMVGLFDDLKVLSPGLKLAGQLVAALVAVKSGILIQLTFLPVGLAAALSVLWLVAITNAVNLIDVSDGLATGVSSIAGTAFYVVAVWNGATTIEMLILALVGAAIGFLRFNLPPARIFLGDTGSMLLGFMLAALAMIGHYTFRHALAAIAPAVILGVPIFDTCFVIGARLVRRIPVMRGSPDHYAVRLRNHGIAPIRIALGSYAACGLLGVAGLAICQLPVEEASIVAGGVLTAALGAAVAFARLGRSPER